MEQTRRIRRGAATGATGPAGVAGGGSVDECLEWLARRVDAARDTQSCG
jgi:hypothetical protein